VQAYLAFKKIQKKGAEVKVGKLAESFIIRIPKPIAEILELEKGKTVKLKLANPRELRIASD
jgi:antitoxin component of MazEF toxin-antitoxin module